MHTFRILENASSLIHKHNIIHVYIGALYEINITV